MTNTDSRLTAYEADIWARLWACHMKLPNTLDAQLKRDADVTYFEFQALLKISESPTNSRRMTELSEATSMSLSHLSRVVTRLERKGLVARIPDPNDGRSTFAALTPAGESTVDTGLPGHLSEMRRIVFDNLSDSEIEVVSAALSHIANALFNEVPSVKQSRLVEEAETLDAA